jgi:anti-sigma regulatory factor (Ser/Thr protein kinase)
VTSYQRPGIPCGPVACMELASLPTTPFCARRQTRAVLEAWLLPSDSIDTAELLVSELVTNATKFSSETQAPERYLDLEKAERICLTLRLLRDRLIIEVTDSDPSPPVLTEAGLDAEGGRGLMLVDALSKEWSFFSPPTGGKTVYCVLGISS